VIGPLFEPDVASWTPAQRAGIRADMVKNLRQLEAARKMHRDDPGYVPGEWLAELQERIAIIDRVTLEEARV